MPSTIARFSILLGLVCTTACATDFDDLNVVFRTALADPANNSLVGLPGIYSKMDKIVQSASTNQV
jgi:hypothetical protein